MTRRNLLRILINTPLAVTGGVTVGSTLNAVVIGLDINSKNRDIEESNRRLNQNTGPYYVPIYTYRIPPNPPLIIRTPVPLGEDDRAEITARKAGLEKQLPKLEESYNQARNITVGWGLIAASIGVLKLILESPESD